MPESEGRQTGKHSKHYNCLHLGKAEVLRRARNFLDMDRPGAGIMEADDRQVTTVFTVQPSFHHPYSTNLVS